MRWVGNFGSCPEVAEVGRVLLVGGKLNGGVVHLDAFELVETLELERLLEVDRVRLGQTARGDGGLALDGDLEGLVVGEPLVEGGEGLAVVDLNVLLGDINHLELVGVGLREANLGKGVLRAKLLKVHVADEGVNGSLDLAISADGRVDGHEIPVGLGVLDGDALNLELGLVDLVLGNDGDNDIEAAENPVLANGTCKVRKNRHDSFWSEALARRGGSGDGGRNRVASQFHRKSWLRRDAVQDGAHSGLSNKNATETQKGRVAQRRAAAGAGGCI